MTLRYDLKYTRSDIIEAVETLATCWKKKPEDVENLDTDKLHKTVRGLLTDWSEKKSTSDHDFMALLILLRGCESWFTDDQFVELECWLGIVSEAGTNSGWQDTFGDEAVKEAVKVGLQCSGEITITRDASGLSIEYVGGDYGTGSHNGTVVLTNHALNLYNSSTPKIRNAFISDLPSSTEELAAALQGDNWDEVPVEE